VIVIPVGKYSYVIAQIINIFLIFYEYRRLIAVFYIFIFNDTMTLLKRIDSPSLLLPYEQIYIQLFHHNNYHIPEQQNLVFQLLYDKCITSNPYNI